MRSASSRLIVAFDSGELPQVLKLARKLRGLVRYAKIGSVLFTAQGPLAIRRMQGLGYEVFLDLKFHDIPSTVEKSCRAAAHHGVWMLTVHASAQQEMLEAAVAGARQEAAKLGVAAPRVVGVTVLTSVAAAKPGSHSVLERRVVELALAAKQAGLDGVVASAREAEAIRRRVGRPFTIVCPGIRPAAGQEADQARVASPCEAVARGADLLVVGRPITQARDPRAVVEQLIEELETDR